MRIALLSDIHADTNEDNSDSANLKLGAERRADTHPFDALNSLIENEKLQIDVLMCAGDLGTKSKPSTIEFTWKELNSIKSKHNIPLLVSTPGNHDHDSK